jgi:DNA-binding response OmpR family regulator
MTGDNGHAKKILLVDDEPRIRELRALILEGQGHQVETADTLEEARAAWLPGKYSLIIVDLRRQPQEAMDFCEEIKAESPEQLIAFLTAPMVHVSPPNSCPDDVIRQEEGPEEFVKRVQSLLA